MEKFMYKKEPVCYVRNSSLISSEVDDDLVMIDIDKGSYFGLNETARAIWNFLEVPKPYDDILNYLSSLYSVNSSECQEDVDVFLQDMLAHQLVQEI